MDPSEKLLAWYADLRFGDLPAEAVEASRTFIIDTIGCALAGSSAPLNAELVERHLRWGGAPEATVLVYGNRLPAPAAALLNAAMIHSNDYDDTHDPTAIHVFVTLLPAMLAAAESLGRPTSGKDFIAALAGAAEVTIRLGNSVRDHIHAGWLPTTVFGAIGAAAGAAKITGLGESGVLDAAGLGYAQTHGNRQALLDATLAKRLQPAFSAQAGVQAAALAEIGATGPRRLAEGADGIFELFGGGKGDPEALTEGLGERWEMSRISVKPYPCCRSNHGVISAAEEARDKLGAFTAGDIESVDVWVTRYSYSMVGQPFEIRQNPQVDAQFSAQWTSAHTLLHGPPGIASFEPQRVVSGNAVKTLAERTRVHIWEGGEGVPDSDAPFRLSRVAARLKDGRAADVTHERVKGSPEWPLTNEERRAKFTECAGCAARSLDPARVAEALAALEAIQEQPNIAPLLGMLTAQPAMV
ncbi:MAG: MmgE/PrpD family protein [Nitrospinota bacterium]|nr:MmgE/PrpD family protein [Nitrospinota bacterium]